MLGVEHQETDLQQSSSSLASTDIIIIEALAAAAACWESNIKNIQYTGDLKK